VAGRDRAWNSFDAAFALGVRPEFPILLHCSHGFLRLLVMHDRKAYALWLNAAGVSLPNRLMCVPRSPSRLPPNQRA